MEKKAKCKNHLLLSRARQIQASVSPRPRKILQRKARIKLLLPKYSQKILKHTENGTNNLRRISRILLIIRVLTSIPIPPTSPIPTQTIGPRMLMSMARAVPEMKLIETQKTNKNNKHILCTSTFS